MQDKLHAVNPVFKGHPHVKELVIKGQLSCRDTFSGILRYPEDSFTVYTYLDL